MKNEPVFPLEITKGGAVVRIFRQVSSKNYESFTVAYYQDQVRKREVLSDFALAKKRAKKVVAALSKGEVAAASLKLEDQRAYLNAKRLLKPTKVTLEAACREYAAAVKLLGGVSILAAAQEYVKRHGGGKPSLKTVQEVVTEFMEAKEEGRSTRLRGNGRNVSDKYLYQLRLKLDAFAGQVKGLIGSVTAEAVNDFIHKRKGASGRTKNNYLQALNVLFEFARKQGYVTRDFDLMDKVESAAEEDFEIEIFTPQEFKLLLGHCPESLVPVLAIGALAGLRTAEIERLDWREINLASKFIEVKAKKAKTRARRLVPIVPALAAWLQSYRADDEADGPPTEGPVWPQSLPYLFELQRDAAKEAGVDWKHNALRHSFISYRVAEIKNVAEVALEAGNSPEMIFQHYRELVTGEAAKEWFGITPAVIEAEAKQIKEEAARLRAARAEAEKAKGGKKRGAKKVGAVPGVPVPAETKIVAFPAEAAA
ncbi:MAG TPA: site-specific integrase [Verrucomicrobiae bacterium]|nr:site-specific integrase [Verrucomicrobiae bacterium]